MSRTKDWTRTTHEASAQSLVYGLDPSHELHLTESGNSPSPVNRAVEKSDGHRQSDLSGEAVSLSTGEIGHSDRTDRLCAQTDIASFRRKSVDIMGFNCGSSQYSDHQVAVPIAFPPIIGDSKNITSQKWESLGASERVAFLQRWLMYAEVKYKGPVDCWPEAFVAEWLIFKDSPSALEHLVSAGHKVAAGKSALNYVARVMEGDLPNDPKQWRMLYTQAYHITGILNSACTRLQCMIDNVLVHR